MQARTTWREGKAKQIHQGESRWCNSLAGKRRVRGHPLALRKPHQIKRTPSQDPSSKSTVCRPGAKHIFLKTHMPNMSSNILPTFVSTFCVSDSKLGSGLIPGTRCPARSQTCPRRRRSRSLGRPGGTAPTPPPGSLRTQLAVGGWGG